MGQSKVAGGWTTDGRRRRLAIAFGIYVLLTALFFAFATRERIVAHSPYNHYALLADAWLNGRLDLGGPPPVYAGNNDFAQFQDKTYVSFPPLPAVLLLPIVALADDVERVRDAQFFLWLAGLGPALLFLVLERLRITGRSARQQWHNVVFALLFALGTVYWFTAVQGTVWFAAHVVAVALLALYALYSLDAKHPLLAGLALGLVVATRPTVALAFPLFAYEAFRAARAAADRNDQQRLGRIGGASTSDLLRRCALFAAPVAAVVAVLAWHNWARFSDPTEFGHRFLTVVWRGRIDQWGLFSYHYLARNLGVVLTSLPYWSPAAGWQINSHGLALWVTTPLYAWALWPKRTGGLFWAVAVSAALVAIPNLLYQNTGWLQFGYRFSNDFAPLLWLMIALGGRGLRLPFWLLAAWSLFINGFGAWTFGKKDYQRHYVIDRTQRQIYQPD